MDLQLWHASVLASSLCAVPGLVLLAEVLLARAGEDGGGGSDGPAPTFRVLIPAHDEAVGIGECLRALLPLLPSDSTVLVVADNCSDETAAVASELGVEVLVRDEPGRRGKGYALQYGLDHLAQDPPECVVFLDADSVFTQGGAVELARLAAAAARPVQGVFRMEAHAGAALPERVAALAVRLKNTLRAEGLMRVGGAVSLLGSGFAMPWSACDVVPPPAGELAEDAVWGWRLADAGLAPIYTRAVACEGRLAQGGVATSIQRARWERGTLLASWRVLPAVLLRAVRHGRGGVALLALDGLVPPLSLLAFASIACAAFGVHAGLPAYGALAPLALVGGALLIAWMRVGRDLVATHELFALPLHALIRLVRLPVTIASGGEWRRTPREEAAGE